MQERTLGLDTPFFRVASATPTTAAARVLRQPVSGVSMAGTGAATTEPVDLVARALAILDEENAAWQARRTPALRPGRLR